MRKATNLLVAVALVCAYGDRPAHAGEHDVRVAVRDAVAASHADGLLSDGLAGYDSGFLIRGREFSARINLTLRTRFEAYRYANTAPSGPNGNLSGFALPRATLKLSGAAPCNTRWYTQLEFGHFGRDAIEQRLAVTQSRTPSATSQTWNFNVLREAWLEIPFDDALQVRVGLIQTPGPRGVMVPEELTQFVAPSIGAAFLGQNSPGYTDRSRDYGAMIHGVFGKNDAGSYAASFTSGEGGDGFRTVLDHRSEEDPDFAARFNWAFWKPIGYVEGALSRRTSELCAEAGIWGRVRSPGILYGNDYTRAFMYGLDAAVGYGPWTLTGWFGKGELGKTDDSWFIAGSIQVGYHFPRTPWEVAVRFAGYDVDSSALFSDNQHYRAERAVTVVVNYYLNGRGNKLQLEGTGMVADDEIIIGPTIWDAYSGTPGGLGNNNDLSLLLRFQWQLAL